MDKEDVAHIYNGILLSHKKKRGPRDYHTKRSKSEGERQIPYNITYMWNLKYDRNELICKTKTDSETQKTNLRLPKGKGSGGGIN